MDNETILEHIADVADTGYLKQMIVTMTLRDEDGNEEEKKVRVIIAPEDISQD